MASIGACCPFPKQVYHRTVLCWVYQIWSSVSSEPVKYSTVEKGPGLWGAFSSYYGMRYGHIKLRKMLGYIKGECNYFGKYKIFSSLWTLKLTPQMYRPFNYEPQNNIHKTKHLHPSQLQESFYFIQYSKFPCSKKMTENKVISQLQMRHILSSAHSGTRECSLKKFHLPHPGNVSRPVWTTSQVLPRQNDTSSVSLGA